MYLKGFGNHHETEAIKGALPRNQNSPQNCPLGLYAEQLSGSAFTTPRERNYRSWLYRILPSVVQGSYEPLEININKPIAALQMPNPMRWSPLFSTPKQQDFIDGIFHIASTSLIHTYLYQCNQSMNNRYVSSYDGEFLLIPYKGEISLHTEMGCLEIKPGFIAVIPRGIKFSVKIPKHTSAEGYLCENSGAPLTLPYLGLIGANSLANPRHFLYPKAAYEEMNGTVEVICKYQQNWWKATSTHSPLNVVAWQGNYAPYMYDLSLFNTLNTVSFDHPDPSIFTVLTSVSDTAGVANLDFVIFPERWMVAEHTFRLPYYHRNIMSELMGLIKGAYDAKSEAFSIGGVSIHNTMTGHGPDAESYSKELKKKLAPERYSDTLAFMLESREPWRVTDEALQHPKRDQNYSSCWKKLPIHFHE